MSLGVEWGAKYTLVGPDGTTAVFNDSTDPNFVGILNPESSGLDSPEVREDAQDSTESDGGIHGNFFYGRRPVVLQGTIIASSATDRNAKVSKLLRASNAMRGDAKLSWKLAGATSEVFVLLRRQQPVRVTNGFVKNFFVPMVSAAAEIKSTVTKASASNFEERQPGGNPTVVNATGIGTVAWTNPGNASASDNAYAVAEVPLSGASNYLKTSVHKFTLPANSFIMYVKSLIEGKAEGSPGLFPKTISLVKAGTIAGPTAGSTSFTTTGDTVSEHVFGLPGYTKADVENSGFGLAVSVGESGIIGGKALVDQIQARVGVTFPITVENAGDASAEWTAVLVNPTGAILTAPTELVNQTTGQAIVLNTTPQTGEFITIDSKSRTITSNTRGNLYSYLSATSSEWFKLAPGASVIKCDKAQFEITFQDTWI